MNKPLVSIITPTYNHERFISSCIESVLGQSFRDWEMILIDDASTDNTPKIIEKYAESDKRIQFIRHRQNWGIYRLGDTYNQALEIAQGELIAILEGDDFWPIYKLEKQIIGFENNKIVLSWGKAAFTDEQGRVLGFRPIQNFKKSIVRNRPKGCILKELLYKNIIPAVSVLLRKETLLSIGGFQTRTYLPYVDYPTVLMMSLQGEFDFVNNIVGYWRRYTEQSTAQFSEEQAIAASKFAQEFLLHIPGKIKDAHNFTSKKVVNYEKYRIAYSNLSLGRLSLAKHKWRDARSIFRSVMKRGPLLTKLIAFAGIFLSLFKNDLKLFTGIKNKSIVKPTGPNE